MKEFRVVVLGAGMAGILAGIKLKEMGIENVKLYEKADRVGGTWRENTYPGLTCDTPSHHYTYKFERNPNWSRTLPAGEEIQAYFEQVSNKYGIDKLVRFNEEAVGAEFSGGRWQLAFKSGLTDSADALIIATGVLHHPVQPDIPGTDSFGGALFHSARWDHGVALDGRRIGVIGNGSTGVQIVSALAGRMVKLEHFQRTAQWIMPVNNDPYTDAERASFQDPEVLAAAMNFAEYNQNVDAYTQAIINTDSEAYRFWADACVQNLEQSVRDPDLRERLRPDHMPMCKRLIFSPDYYEAIQHPDSALVTADIERIEEKGIRTADGELHELDIIVMATGFDARAFMRPMQVRGRNGADLDTLWAEHPKAYMAISMPDFPNLFMLNGPNGPVGNFTLVDIAEHQWSYIAQLLEKLRSGEAREIAATLGAMEKFEAERAEAAKKTVWYIGGCNSWYLDAQGIPASWPWTYMRFLELMSAPDWSAYEVV